MSLAGYLDSPWPCEDGGPQRLQRPASGPALRLHPGEKLACTTRNTMMSTMTILGAPGEVYLLTHSALRAQIGLPTSARVERIDPHTLRPLRRSPRLPGGPMWPGGMAIHRDGQIYVVYGRYLHRLDRDCAVTGALMLPVDQPYNSFVILENGHLVTKNLSDVTAARLSVIDGTAMASVAEIECPEASIARLSAVGNNVYVVGVRSIFRFSWDDRCNSLVRDPDWRFAYTEGTAQTYGWDVVLADGQAWFMDNGKHRYRIRMIGAGIAPSPNRLIRVSLANGADHTAWDICGLPHGSITNPPVIDSSRKIVVAYDSANAFLRAWRYDDAGNTLSPLWQKSPFGCASHMILYPESGELVTNDYRRGGEEMVVLRIETGEELGRVRAGGMMQGVVFPSPGWERDFYWCSMGRLARAFVR